MNKQEKAESVAEIKDLVSNSTALFLVDYHGINVANVSQLRRDFQKEGTTYKVFKNTLLKRALQDAGGYDELLGQLTGMTGIAFAGENFVAPAKIIKKYFDDKKNLKFKGCYIDSTYYGEDQLEILASMPTKDEIMASIIGSIANPATGIVGAINAVMRDVVSCIDQISKKEAA
ncbi:MAG: 50S ribosomal protein L10 [Ignavibacteriales bacterium]|jgi:large subunit ribosomal protein L10|nr:50S ribosomal protein L10 [Melioribacteraceae bacterium]RJP63534.1 MAG: 50S ribosomal protein L10 [Ignavibacteriales bacterium]